jgi:hypothetical protein
VAVHPRSIERALARLSIPSHPGGGGPPASCPSASSREHTEHLCRLYEELRIQALGRGEPDGRRSRGQELLVRRGMPDWILAMVQSTEGRAEADGVERPGDGRATRQLVDDLRPTVRGDREMAVALANLVLSGDFSRRAGRA